MQTLGAALGSGLHAILAHQSLYDLRGTSADLDPDMVKGAVMDNTKIKLCYRQEDPDTAELYAKKSGAIQIETQTKYYDSPELGLSLVQTSHKTTQQQERYYIDTNMLLHLPKGCAGLYGLGLTQLLFTSPIVVSPNAMTIQTQSYGEDKTYHPPSLNPSQLADLIHVT